MDDYLKLNIINFFNYIDNIDIKINLEKQINDFYNKFECCDFDLYNYDINNKYEKLIKQVIEFYYDNIERIINDFNNESAVYFTCELKNYCSIQFDEIIQYLELK